MNALSQITRTKPVTILATLQALLACAIAFGLVELDGAQLAAVEGLLAALGLGSASQVTANTRLDPTTIAAARERPSPWAAPLTSGDADLIGEALSDSDPGE